MDFDVDNVQRGVGGVCVGGGGGGISEMVEIVPGLSESRLAKSTH